MNKHTISYIFAVLIVGLGAVAIYLALRIFQLKTTPIAPNVPQSTPAASEPTTTACEDLTLTLTLSSPSPTPIETFTESETPSPSPTPTEPPIGGTGTPVPTPSPTPVPTPSPTTVASPTAAPTSIPLTQSSPSSTLPPDVPVTGGGTSTLLAIGIGVVMLIIAIRVAL